MTCQNGSLINVAVAGNKLHGGYANEEKQKYNYRSIG